MKRILHVVSCLERGGTEAFIMNHYRMIDRAEYQFDFLVFHEKTYPYTEEIRNLGGRIFFCTPPSRKDIFRSIKEMTECMKNHGPFRAVHSHMNIENAWVMVAAKLAGIPVRVSHSHDTKGREGTGIIGLYRHFQSMLIKLFANRIAACGIAAGNYLYGERFFKKRGCVIHNGIDVARFQNISEEALLIRKKEFAISEEQDLVFGNITRFEDKKNQMFALEVFREVAGCLPNAVLLLGGPDGGRLGAVMEKTSELGLADRVRFIGERDDIPACLNLIDIYLFPSLYEGLPIALLEAQAAGCFCISSTEVSAESDMGIGQLVFCGLADGTKQWADVIVQKAIKHSRPEAKAVQEAFKKNGYDIRFSAQKLMDLYE